MRMEAQASLVEGKRLFRRDMLLRLQRRRQTLEESKLQLDVPFSPEHGNGHRQRRPQQMTQLQPVPVKSRSGRTIVPVECVNSAAIASVNLLAYELLSIHRPDPALYKL